MSFARKITAEIKRLTNLPRFPRVFRAASLTVLLASTLLWGILGLSLQQSNADQLTSPYLFSDSATFHGAEFPSQHTFLLKWPLFLVIKLAGLSNAAYVTTGLITVLLTVGSLAFVMSRIERRPIVLGTLYMALASCLLLIPAQPYAGALLPVNLAMLTTRNIEYIVFIGSLYLLLKTSRIRSWTFWGSCGLLILLVASDKLFLSIGIVASAVSLMFYATEKGWGMVGASARWLIASIISAVGAFGLISLINFSRLTHIGGQSGLGPYRLVTTFHDLVLGIIYGLLGLLTNFGANPAFDANIVRNIPQQTIHRWLSWEGPALLINLTFFAVSLWCIYQIVRRSFHSPSKRKINIDVATGLSLGLSAAALSALVLFVISGHYYAVDSRYLAISLFAAGIAIATYTRQNKWKAQNLFVAGVIILCSMAVSLPGVIKTHHQQKSALAGTDARNALVVQVLEHHPVNKLIGDYWRVMPIKQDSKNKLNVTPLANCTQVRQDLSSSAWSANFSSHSFAYLLSIDRGLTDFPSCSLEQVINKFGRPNSSVLIAGPQSRPSELLLFYDKGARPIASKAGRSTPGTVLPIQLGQLPYTACPSGSTTMNIVAHEDDDLLFINPDTQNALRDGHCVRTIYLTAGDAGNDNYYWLSREQGSEAAYSTMLGSNALWVRRIVQIGPQQYIQVSHPEKDYRATLIFLHLPDGNLAGSGFPRYGYESLARLEAGDITNIETVDAHSSYSASQLIDTLVQLIRTYQPEEIHTQSTHAAKGYADHSDHMAVGRYTKKALTAYESEQSEDATQIRIKYYVGYPVSGMPVNIKGEDLTHKEAPWFAYSKYDGAVCHAMAECGPNFTYGIFLRRQYTTSY